MVLDFVAKAVAAGAEEVRGMAAVREGVFERAAAEEAVVLDVAVGVAAVLGIVVEAVMVLGTVAVNVRMAGCRKVGGHRMDHSHCQWEVSPVHYTASPKEVDALHCDQDRRVACSSLAFL